MKKDALVKVEAIYTHPNSAILVSTLESNLDLEKVLVKRSVYAIKGIVPFTLIITTASAYLLEKFILAPIIDPVAERYNWAKVASKYLSPMQPFNLTIFLVDDKVTIETELGTHYNLTVEIWKTINKTLDILKIKNKLRHISKIRFTTTMQNKILIICYENNKPKFTVDLTKEDINRI